MTLKGVSHWEKVKVVLHEAGVKHGFEDLGSPDFNEGVYKKLLIKINELLGKLR